MALLSRVPDFLKEDPANADMITYITVEDEAYQLKRDRVACLREQFDVLTMQERFLWYELREKGWDADIQFDSTQQRDLLRFVTTVLKGRGWMLTIADTIYLLFGVIVNHVALDPITLGFWRIGVSKIGVDAIIGDRELKSKVVLSLETPEDVDEETRQKIIKVAEFLRPATKLFLYQWDVTRGPFPPKGWFIEISGIGFDADIQL